MKLDKYQFADDTFLLTTSKRAAELVTNEYMHVAEDLGLTLSMPKTKVMAVGRNLTSEDRTPLRIGDEIELVCKLPYLVYLHYIYDMYMSIQEE